MLSYYEQGFGKHSADPKYQKNIAFVLGGVAGLWWFPTGWCLARFCIAKSFEVSELIVGLTIIATGVLAILMVSAFGKRKNPA